MYTCFGIANSTLATVIGIVQLISSCILYAAYYMGYKILSKETNHYALLENSTEAIKDFITSTGLYGSNEAAVINIIVLYMILYLCKGVFATGLLIAICKDSCLLVKTWLLLEVSTFSFRLGLFVASLLLTYSTFTTAVIYSSSFLLEFYCIWVVHLFTKEMSCRSQLLDKFMLTEPLRIHSFRGMKRASQESSLK